MYQRVTVASGGGAGPARKSWSSSVLKVRTPKWESEWRSKWVMAEATHMITGFRIWVDWIASAI
jgi:hypothetical protein